MELNASFWRCFVYLSADNGSVSGHMNAFFIW